MDVLLIDGDRATTAMLIYLLREAGYRVASAGDGPGGLETIARQPPDLVLLEAVLPTADGFSICRAIRRTSDVPLIFLSARASVQDRVLGLQLGADDYIAKPFEPADLLARIGAVLRRCGRPLEAPAARISHGDLTLDPLNHKAHLDDGRAVDLTPQEFRLLAYLMTNAGQPLSPGQILAHVWAREGAMQTSIITTYILRLRSKIEPDPARPRYIITVRNLGYRFDPQHPAKPAQGTPLAKQIRSRQPA